MALTHEKKARHLYPLLVFYFGMETSTTYGNGCD